jgi:hypothetical protein
VLQPRFRIEAGSASEPTTVCSRALRVSVVPPSALMLIASVWELHPFVWSACEIVKRSRPRDPCASKDSSEGNPIFEEELPTG